MTEIRITPRHPLIGAEIHGVDLRQPLSEEAFQAIHDAWMQHLLLVFPDQPITDAQHVVFGERFGALEIHPSLAHRASGNPAIYRVSNVDEQGELIPPTDTG